MRKKAVLLLSIIIILMYVCTAHAQFAPHYQAFSRYINSGALIKTNLSAQLSAWYPYPTDRIEQMNRLLKHLSLEILSLNGTDRSSLDFSLLVGQYRPVYLSAYVSDGNHVISSNLLTERYRLSGNALFEALGPLNMISPYDTTDVLFDELLLLQLPEHIRTLHAFNPLADMPGKTVKKNGKLLKTVSYTQRIDISLPTGVALDRLSQISAALYAVSPDLSIPKPNGDMVQVCVYKNKKGVIIGETWTFPYQATDQTRHAVLTWTYSQTGSTYLDNLEFITTAANKKDKLVYTANFANALSMDLSSGELSASFKADTLLDGKKAVETVNAKFISKPSDGGESFTGSIYSETSVGKNSSGYCLFPDVFTSDTGDSMNGSMRIQTLEGKNTHFDITIHFTLNDAGTVEIYFPSQSSQTMRDIDSPEDLAIVQNVVMQRAIKEITSAVLSLPVDDLILITQFISEANFQRIPFGNYQSDSVP